MNTIAGIDPSLTNTGLARIVTNGIQWSVETWSLPSTGRLSDTIVDRHKRAKLIMFDVLTFVEPCALVVIESPSFGSRGGSQWDRAGLWWAIVGRLIEHGVPVATVAPTTRALWAAGRGNADKAAVATAIGRMWPDVELRDSDQVDALALASIGVHLMYESVSPFSITDYRTRAMAKVAAPESMEDAA